MKKLLSSSKVFQYKERFISQSVGQRVGLIEALKNEKGGRLTRVYLGEKTTFSWEWLINWFDQQQIPVDFWFDQQAF